MDKEHAPFAFGNNRWKDLVDRLPVMIFESDLANKIIYTSENVYETLGYRPDEMIGKNGLELFPPEDRQYLLQNIRKKLEGKMLEPAKYRIRKKNGEYITAIFRAVPVLKDGKQAGMLVAAIDITAQKEKQLQLEKESYLLKKSQELGHIGTWELSLKTKQVKASEELIKLYGLPPKAHYTMEDFAQRIHPEDMKEHLPAWDDRSVLKEGSFNSTYRLLANGKVTWINAVGEVKYDEKGTPHSVIAAVQDITRQKLAEIELKELEQQKAAILNAIPDMIFVIDKEGVYQDYVAGVDIQPLVSPEQFLGKKITEVLPYKVAKEHLTLLQKAFATGNIQVSGYQLEINDKTSYFEARISPVDDNKAVVVVRDVTQRENDRKALLKTNENLKLYSKAMDESPVSIVITDREAKIQYVNHQFTKITGYLPGEVIGQNTRILKSGFQDSSFYQNLWETILSGKTWTGEFHNKKKNGDPFWEAASINPIYNQENEITHFVAIKEDITQKKKDMQVVQEMASIVDSSDAIIIGKTLDGIIRAWNRGAEHVYGYKAEEVIGLPVNILVPHALKKELESFTDKIKAGERVENFETQRICKNGKKVEVSLSLSGIINEKGTLTGISVVGQDITRQKQLERELITEKERAEEATRAKSLFLANMSHEIRTPMNAILGFAEILSQRIKDPVQHEHLVSMQNSGKALLNLINDLLDFSKAEAGKLELHEQSTDVRYLVHDIESIFRLKARQKNLDFVVEIDKNVSPDMLLDEMKIRQVLLNLTSNAIKFTEKGRVKISVRSDKIDNSRADLILEVSDTGKGIPPEYHEKIFQLFEQQDTGITRKYGGTGLGLAITMQIVQLMKGRIGLMSEEGKGSTFRVVLPAIPLTGKKAVRQELPESDLEKLVFDPATILIVDDTPSNIVVLKAMLENQPFVLLEAQNGRDALEVMKENKVDLVFMDIRMPEMDGIKAVKAVRNHEEWSHIPVIALSASSTDFDSAQLVKKGFNGYVRKPASQAEIVRTLEKYLKYDIKDKSSNDDIKVLSPETVRNFSVIMESMENQILPLQQGLLGIRPRKEVENLAKFLMAIGKKYKSEEVLRYGKKLLVANKYFLLEKEKKLIENLPDFVKQLKDMYNEYRNK